MRSILNRFAGVMLLQFLVLSALPAVAISVDLAKKCREMAIKAHPRPHGHMPYAQAERDFSASAFRRMARWIVAHQRRVRIRIKQS